MIAGIIVLYFIIAFIVIRLIIPYFGFSTANLPNHIPDTLQKEIDMLNENSSSNLAYVKNAYEYITSNYYGSRLKTITNVSLLFKNPLEMHTGFMYCTQQNYLLRILLIKSKRFSEKDIKIVAVPFNFILHQYLDVKIDGKWIHVDPWSKALGIPFGGRSFLFG